MSAIIRQTDKRSGITYAYESVSYWDKEKRQSRAKRTLIGRVDDKTGGILPTKGTNRKDTKENSDAIKRGPVPITSCSRYFYGATYLFDVIGDKLGVTADLKSCFPDTYKQILSIAYYLILEDSNPLSRFPKWAALHKHPYHESIPSQRSSELFASITEEEKFHFFRLQGKRRIEKEYWAYDTTSISSYSDQLKQAQYGVNKENDPLAQINLALIFGEQSNLPFYYRKLSGNISDVKTVKNLLADMDFLNLKKIHFVMDRGFYSEANINALYQEHLKFLMGAKLSLKFVSEHLDKSRNTIREWTNYSQRHDVFATTITTSWCYSQERPYKGDILKEERRMYLHIYYNAEKAVEEERHFTQQLLMLQEELQTGQTIQDHKKLSAKYFETSTTPVRGIKVTAKQNAIDEAKKNFGYFILVSNEIKDPTKALDIYRNKDLVEKAFGNLKERLNMRRLAVSSEQSLDGKLFVAFVALIYLSYLKKMMQDKSLFRKYTMQDLLDQFDVIECFEQPGYSMRIGEITKRQKELFELLEITPPTSL